METNVISPAIKGALIAVLLIAFAVTIQLMGDFRTSQKYSWVQFAIIIVGVIWACITYTRQMAGAVTFGSVFAHGFKVTAIFTIIYIIFTILSIKFLFPDMVDKAMEITREKMESDPQAKDNPERIEQGLAMVRKNFLVFAVLGVMVMDVLVGAIAALIGAAVAKKNPNSFPAK